MSQFIVRLEVEAIETDGPVSAVRKLIEMISDGDCFEYVVTNQRTGGRWRVDSIDWSLTIYSGDPVQRKTAKGFFTSFIKRLKKGGRKT